MKKSILAVLLLLSFSLFMPTVLFASQDLDDPAEEEPSDVTGEENPDESFPQNDDIVNFLRTSCFCGRDYHTEDANGHSAYDCVKCGKNMYVCTCNCWCGKKSVLDTSGNYGAVIPLICTGCNKPCLLCDCHSDRAAVLRIEEQRRTGEISSLNLLRPHGAFIVVTAVLTAFGIVAFACVASSFSPLKKIVSEKTKHSEDEEKHNEHEEIKEDKSVNPVEEKPEIYKETFDFSEETFELYRLIFRICIDLKKNSGENFTGFTPLDNANFSVTAEETDIFLRVLNLSNKNSEKPVNLSQISPITRSADENAEKTLISLLERGAITVENGEYYVPNPLCEYLTDLFNPRKSFILESVRDNINFTVCRSENAWYLVNEENGYGIRVFMELQDLIYWINENITIPDKDSNIPSGADVTLDYDEYCFFAVCQVLALQDYADFTASVCGDICTLLSKRLEKNGLTAFSPIFSRFSDEEERSLMCEALYKKGIMVKNDDIYEFSPFADNVLGISGIENCVIVRTFSPQGTDDMLFAVRNNGVCVICDTKSSVRAVTAKNIPWKNYFGTA